MRTSLRDVNIKWKMAALPALAIIVFLLLGGYSGSGFSSLKNRIDDVAGSFNAHQEIAVLTEELLSINGETHKLIVWTSTDYPPDQRKRLEASIRNMLQDIQKKIASDARYSKIGSPFKKYGEWILKTIDMAVIDASAASMFAGSVEEAFQMLHSEMGRMDKETRAVSAKSYAAALTKQKSTVRNSWIMLAIAVVLFAALAFLIARSMIGPIRRVAEGLSEGADQVTAASREVASSSQQAAEGATKQAAAIESTASTLEQTAAMIKQNAGNASQADAIMRETGSVVGRAVDSMQTLTKSMAEISAASEETQNIVKTIDEISFQTNLLALNAAVEAARAGEAGAGFAVVAGEVRNLAMRAAEAARNTANMIEGTVRKVKDGAELVTGTNEAFEKVAQGASKVGQLVAEIAAASNEQALGIDQVNRGVAEMDQVVQQNAASAEETASASEEMNAQAEHLNEFVGELLSIIGLSRKERKETGGQFRDC